MPHRVELYLGTTRHRLTNWDGYEIALDMFKPGSPWTFGLWHSDAADSAWRRMLIEAQLGAPVVVEIDGAPQLNGRIEERVVKVDRPNGAVLTISGRDLSGPAIDWDVDPRVSVRGRTLEDVLDTVFRPLGIDVVVSADAAETVLTQAHARPGGRVARTARRAPRRQVVDLAKPKPGERVWQFADAVVRRIGYMMWVAPSPEGRLAVVVDVPNYEQLASYRFERRLRGGVVTPDSNILESEYTASIRDVPTHVYAFGRAARGARRSARHRAVDANLGLHLFNPLLDPTINAAINPLLTPGGEPLVPAVRRLAALGLHLAMPGLTGTPPAPAAPPALTAPPGRAGPATRRDYGNESLESWSLRSRPLVVSPLPPQPRFLHTARAKSPATGQQEAARVIAEAMRFWRTYECVVEGHGQTVEGAPRLYAVNTMAHVHDALAEVDEEMLLYRVQFSGGRTAGQTTRLTLGTKGAVVLQPEAA
jgi:prophage tail gpP-like protein